jgi:sugar fermentation stimulation protein A
MDFPSSLVPARYLRREKRFFLYAEHGGLEVTSHCPNTGSLKGVLEHTHRVWLLDKGEVPGKLRYCAEIAEFADGTLVGIHPARANALAREAVASGLLPLAGDIKAEAVFDPHTRFDFKIGPTWVEVKSVSLAQHHTAMFPDAVSSRGLKHLGHLTNIVRQGGQAAQVYIVQRGDCTAFSPAEHIDPLYAAALRAAAAQGIAVHALACRVTPQGIAATHPLAVIL